MADNSFTRMGSLLANVPELQQAKDVRMTKAEQIAWRAAAGKDISDHTVIKADRGEWQITADSPVWGDAVRQRQMCIRDRPRRAGGIRPFLPLARHLRDLQATAPRH